jgi:ribonuclease HI
MILRAFTDGASRGNPGEAGIGVVVKDEKGRIVLELSGGLGKCTNNVAEYRALLALLARVPDLSGSRIVIHSDSELMVRQLNGQYRVRDKGLRPYFEQARRLLRGLPIPYELRSIPREENREADVLANKGIAEHAQLPSTGSEKEPAEYFVRINNYNNNTAGRAAASRSSSRSRDEESPNSTEQGAP